MKPRSKRTLIKEKAGKPNIIILIFTISMIIFGAVMIFDASVFKADLPPFNDKYYFLKFHLIWLALGMIPASVLYFWDYRKYSKLALPTLVVIIIMLVAVLINGSAANGSSRWLQLGSAQIRIQPAEFAKLAIILYLATWLAKERKVYKTFRDAFQRGFGQRLLGFGAILGVVLALILMEPDLGTTLVVGITAFAMFYISGTDSAHMLGTGIVSLLFAILAIFAAILAPYRLNRVKTFLSLMFTGQVEDPTGTGYQMHQILIGIGSAGFFGKGFGQSRQRFGYLVEITAFTDSIFAVILEEMGMLGGIILIIAWIIFLSEGFKIAKWAPDLQGRYIAMGITIWLATQAFLNMSANVGLIPLTGMPLPFITYGGSGTIVAMMGIAILLNISKFSNREKPAL